MKQTTSVTKKMKLDHNLRMSYKYNQDEAMSFGKKNRKKLSLKMCKACTTYIQKRRQNIENKRNNEKEFVSIDKNKIVYDECQIDYINEHQTKIYIGHVEINPFIKFGIRTHYDKMTVAHCIHSMFV